MVIEWNVHMFSADQERYPLHPDWGGKWPYTPEFADGDPLDAYMEHMDRVGIDRAVLVQPGVLARTWARKAAWKKVCWPNLALLLAYPSIR